MPRRLPILAPEVPDAAAVPADAATEAAFAAALLTPLRALFQPCDDRFFKAIELNGVGSTQKEALEDLEKNEAATDELAERAGTCRSRICAKGTCVYDSATVGKPKCKKEWVTSRETGREEEVWVCRRTFLIGCFCDEEA